MKYNKLRASSLNTHLVFEEFTDTKGKSASVVFTCQKER